MGVMLAGLEAGGTKFVCGVGSGPQDLKTAVVATGAPRETLAELADFFAPYRGKLKAGGIGSFGPVDLNTQSASYGNITSTPKPGWRHFPLLGEVERALGVRTAFDTDVNAALLGEARWGAARGLTDAVYITVGTGVGGGALVGGRVLHGLVHPEMGHFFLPHDRLRDPFKGICPYHGDCLEGLASGPALAARWGVKGTELGPDHEAWPLEAHYVALAVANIIVTLSPQLIVLGGGVFRQPLLDAMVRREVQALLSGYVQLAAITENIDEFIVPPQLGESSGVLGALAMAADLAGVEA
jgi:fructokinase